MAVGGRLRRTVIPAVSTTGTARDVARFYACLPNDGTRTLESEAVER
jgi:hypothetical protein